MRRIGWMPIALLLFISLLVAACSAEIRPANVETVTTESREGAYTVLVEGQLPDACSEIGGTVQTVDGSTIRVGVLLAPPDPEMMCAQMLTPFSETVVLNTEGLAPGEYEVSVNGVTSPLEIGTEMVAQPAAMPAPVASVVVEQRGDSSVLVISGELPDPCHDIGEVTQRTDGSEITVDVEMTPPAADMICAQVITPFTVEVPIDTRLEPGDYTVTVNETAIDVTVK